ncbi:MAG: tRNA (N(6)-L-threonylcarbamoyladenosine(37)-C(2))-methylthiotransferase MtaB [Spirochaetales bacterium]|nr:tRNA (N(6)-L-threonylcarbamoyladenosine(37)-C(2))-methylthiotransferase MtaB [Spirochaetales bacterium]
MKASVYTFGCKLNQYESEALASALRSQGFSLVPVSDAADLYVLNTCTVTSRSEQKARRLIRKLSRERTGSLVLVTGCYAQLNRRDIEVLGANVRVISQEDKSRLLELPRTLGAGSGLPEWDRALPSLTGAAGQADLFAYQVEHFSFHSRGFLKIQDGCDGRCAYCRVPLARGGSVSLEADQVVARLRALEQAGYREVVLTGVDISDYRGGLGPLLRRLLAETEGVRLRLSSLEPERISAELADAASHPRVRPHFHVPVQSGSPRILSAMRRRYGIEAVERAVALLRQAKNDPFLAADMIVGFPGESDEDFQGSRELVERLELSALHVFPFSPRPGTAAMDMRPRVPERVRDLRAHELLCLSDAMRRRYAERWAGRRVEAVLEEPHAGGWAAGGAAWRGLTENYLQARIYGVPEGRGRAGELVEVELGSAVDPEGPGAPGAPGAESSLVVAARYVGAPNG